MMTLGLDVGATRIRASLLDADAARCLGVWRTPAPDDLPQLLATIARHCSVLSDTWGVGIGFAGSLEGDGSVRRWPNRPEFEGYPFKQICASTLGTEPTCLDDCAAAALGEHLARRVLPDRPTTTLYVGVGTGIGGGAVVQDRLYCGATGSAFGLGHLPVPSAGAVRCVCGKSGCLQSVASGKALDRAARIRGLREGAVGRLAKDGDRVALSLLEEVVAPLADGIAMAARLLDPDRVVLGGGILEAGTVLIERLRWALQERSVKCPVESARLGGWSGTLGAAAYASGLDSHLPWTADELSPVTLT